MRKKGTLFVLIPLLMGSLALLIPSQIVRGDFAIFDSNFSATYTGGIDQTVSVSGITLKYGNGTDIKSLDGLNYVHLKLINASSTTVIGDPIDLSYSAQKGWYVDAASLADYGNANYSFSVEVSNATTTTVHEIADTNITVKHGYYFSANFSAYYLADRDSVTVLEYIPIATTYKGAGNESYIDNSSATLHSYVLTNRWGKVVSKGDLVWNKGTDKSGWIVPPEIDLAWGGQGQMTLKVSFQFGEDDTVYDLKTTFSRSNPTEMIILVVAIVGSIIGIIIIAVVIFVKKKGAKIDRYDKPNKKKKPEIKILEISASDIRKGKKGKVSALGKDDKKPKKEKGKTTESKDLIFSVPQWEVDEDDEEEVEAETPTAPEQEEDVTATGTAEFKYNLHCGKCNGWFQVQEAGNYKCPECNGNLNVAVWCQNCQKWFDVPKPGEYACPICEKPLKFKK